MAWAAVAGAAVSVVGGYFANKKRSKSNQAAAKQADPYGPYRAGAAARLDKLSTDAGSIVDTGAYKARLQAAQRVMASQGYTGSGNALAAAATAGGDVYQQAFNNLATLSGVGAGPGQAAQISSQNANTNYNNQGQLANNLMYYGNQAYNNYQNQQAWNTPIDTGGVNTNQSFDTSMNVNTGVDPSFNYTPVSAS